MGKEYNNFRWTDGRNVRTTIIKIIKCRQFFCFVLYICAQTSQPKTNENLEIYVKDLKGTFEFSKVTFTFEIKDKPVPALPGFSIYFGDLGPI